MNKSKRFFSIFVLFAIAISVVVYLVFFRISYSTLQYTESDAILTNPARGFYVQFDTAHLRDLESLADSGITLVLLAYDLKDFVDTELSQAKLDELSQAFKALRVQGLKAIFRAAYGFSDPAKFSDTSSISLIKTHLTQMSPILKENKDVLLSVQAGFLGPWGEWHHSKLGDDQGKPTTQVINALIVALCEAVPQPISIAIRRPSFIRQIDPSLVDLSRIAFHNDSLLSSDTDMGTYDQTDYSRDEELEFIQTRPYPIANGGEMTNLSAYTNPVKALEELSQLKLTYLNHKYNKDVINYWNTTLFEGKPFLDLIQQKMGYRWSIQSATLPDHFKSTQTVKIKLTLTNTGFSAVSLPYRVELIVRSDTGIRQVLPFEGVNLQELNPGKTMTISVSLNIKALSERFSLGLRILETNLIQVTDKRSLVQLANENVTYHNGVNIFAVYEWNDENKFTLIKTN